MIHQAPILFLLIQCQDDHEVQYHPLEVIKVLLCNSPLQHHTLGPGGPNIASPLSPFSPLSPCGPVNP